MRWFEDRIDRRRHPRAGVASVVVHLVGAAGLVMLARAPAAPTGSLERWSRLVLVALDRGARQVTLAPYRRETPPPRPERRAVPAIPMPAPPSVREVPNTDVAFVPIPVLDTRDRIEMPADAVQRPWPGLRPGRGTGNLWVQTLPLAPHDLARRLSRSHAELVDSAVTAIVQAYIDSTLAARATASVPAWMATLGGAKVGIDSRFIYLGPIKIPTLLLALLDVPGGTQIDLDDARQLRTMREDMATAAVRARNLAELRESIRQVRVEQDRLHEIERHRRLNPNDAASRRP